MSMKWISHRGESSDAPENTCSAFKLSLERATDGMECDVHLTADNYLAVGHDETTCRMGDLVRNLEKDTFAELRKVDVSGAFTQFKGEKIPLFEETLQYLGSGRQYFVELKGSDLRLPAALSEILLRHPEIEDEQIIIIAFDMNLLKKAKEVMPNHKTLWLTGLWENGGIMTPDSVISHLKECSADGVDAYSHPDLSESYVRQVKDAGFLFAVWTVDHPGQARRLAEYGVDALTSNRAARLRDILRGE